MDAGQLLLFVPTALLIAATPGPDNLGVLALGLSTGRRASLGFALGCAAGCLNHTLLAVLGITALLATSPLALQLLQGLGAAYLGWIGLQSLRQCTKSSALTSTAQSETTFLAHFRRGLIANAINPKVALFFLAFLPQFVRPGNWSSATQIAIFGLIFTLAAGAVFSMIALSAGSLGRLLHAHPRLHNWLQGFSGVFFIALALRLALTELSPPPVRAPV
ncbi:LysE family translocator [Uliginosibacterium sp. IMCC34675]|uniref:LysE family translocator n=2 Tax=Zoogloeaceae TaxID=2008794 RepID=A0ABX2IFB3_9RHOO|nr:LysE family translocator [Uliginosibacterium aquaticum]PLK48543.1 lysine transporter LysE [Uliginosibacterium sp. TH139]